MSYTYFNLRALYEM